MITTQETNTNQSNIITNLNYINHASLHWKKVLLNKCVNYDKMSNLHLTILVFSIKLYNELIWNEIYII